MSEFFNKTIQKVKLEEEKSYTGNQTYWIMSKFYAYADSDLININLEEIINVDDFLKFLRFYKNGNDKSPGSDGFTVEFLKSVWKGLKYFILNAINFIFGKKGASYFLMFTKK